LAEQNTDHTVSAPALLGDIEIEAPIVMSYARIHELNCQFGQVPEKYSTQRPEPAMLETTTSINISKESKTDIQKDTRNTLRSVMYFGDEGSHTVWYTRSTKGVYIDDTLE